MSKPGSEARPPAADGLVCRECGASNDAGSSECWLCNGRSLASAAAGSSPRPRGFFSSISGWMVAIAGLAVCMGLYALAPGMLFLAAISVLPAIAAVEVKAARRRRLGLPMSAAERVVIFVLITVVTPVLVVGAAVIALIAYCSMTGPVNFH
ncbi:hypothetical protein OJF2_77260 [Aquisphaera giovannonii]|uniref:RanBP2-type domain-containing protein n=1 Tax=Aquisphaera giovannonii TaxID=406548 RepID=A0A5B9WFU1_9BACT|nr:hypothetical protein [Aquisphaera giovannonii]QEH39114.1 hypothetical protein OJF2_77260 [Aquisphaera giovannonii]